MEGRNDRSHEEQKQEEMEAVRRHIIAVRCSWCVYLLWRDGQVPKQNRLNPLYLLGLSLFCFGT